MIQTQFVWMVSKLSISSFEAAISSTRQYTQFVCEIFTEEFAQNFRHI